MRSLRKTIFFVLAVIGLATIVFPVAAQIGPVSGSDFGLPSNSGSAAEVESFVIQLINFVLGFIGLVALVVLIYGGFQYIISAGDEDKAEHAKKTILYAIIGLLVIGLAAVIVNFVISSFIGGGGGGGSSPAP